jgi:CheY-like chemotaxis protein
MLVDDEAAICDSLAAYLEDEGMQVHTARSGEEALQRIEAGVPVSVCVMDLRLPGMSGAETLLAIHASAPLVRFVIHTGSAHASVIDDLRKRGLGDIPVFSKPVEDLAVLAGTVTALADGGPLPAG